MNQAGMGFGGGFASGLANALSMKQQRDSQAKERQIANTWKSIGFLVDSGQVKDIADLQPHFDTLTTLGAFGDPKAQKKGQPGIQDHATNILGHILKTQAAPSPGGEVAPGPQEAPPGEVGPQLEALAPRQLDFPTVAAPSPRTLNGIPLITPEEVAQRGIDAQGAKTTALIDLARNRILPALKAVDPTSTLEDALAAVGVKLPTQKVFTPTAVGRPIEAVALPEGAMDAKGQPIDKTAAPYWQPVRGTNGDIHYMPGAAPSAGGAGGANQLGKLSDFVKRYAEEHGLDLSKIDATTMGQIRQDFAKSGSAAGVSEDEKKTRANEIADAIEQGIQSPDLGRLYGLSGYVREALAERKYDLTKATMDWQTTQRYLSSLNGPQQLRLRQATSFVNESVPLVKQLSDELGKQLPRTKFPAINRAALLAAKQGVLGEDAKNAATNLDNQINELHTELAVMFRGGGAATNEALKRADSLLQSNWDEKQLQSALNLIEQNAKIRLNSMNVGVAGTTGVASRNVTSVPDPDAKAQGNAAPTAKKDPKTGAWVISIP